MRGGRAGEAYKFGKRCACLSCRPLRIGFHGRVSHAEQIDIDIDIGQGDNGGTGGAVRVRDRLSVAALAEPTPLCLWQRTEYKVFQGRRVFEQTRCWFSLTYTGPFEDRAFSSFCLF